jgi:hypothetical protein
MKQKITPAAAILISLLSLPSCEKTIEFTGREQAPLLVINSILSPDTFLTASVSRSVFFLSGDENRAVEDADIRVFINDEPVGKYAFSHNDSVYVGESWTGSCSHYLLSCKPRAGDRVRYEASAPNMQSVYCETVIPQAVEIISLETDAVKDVDNDYDGYGMDFRLKFQDRPHERNFYRIAVYVENFIHDNDDPSVIHIVKSPVPVTSDDRVLDASVPVDGILTEEKPDNYAVFSDELIDGEEYTIKFHSSLNSPFSTSKKRAVIVRLLSITEDYYLYLRTLSTSEAMADVPFAEPVQIYNNISGGIGLLGACSVSEKSVRPIPL